MTSSIRRSAPLLLLAVSSAALIRAAEPDSPEAIEFFEKKIRPVLATRCYACHSSSSIALQGGLMVDSREALRKGGASGKPAIVPGDPEASQLVIALRQTKELKMPPGKPLPAEQVQDFEVWVKMGAPDPRLQTAAPGRPPYDFDQARKFWSFQPVKDAPPPPSRNPLWNCNAIDRFIYAKLAEKGLTPQPLASRRVLLRRATFDLTGLPPTPEEITDFLADQSPNAFEKVVDRLLASPQYGERWGRHWLDVVRYADTSGCNSDYPVPSAYRYRNYVIHAFNNDKPYNRFLQEQISGDLLTASNEEDRQEKVIATGYLANSRRFGSRNNEFHLTIDDTIDNLGKGALGLSVSCARCHDHKFDPIPQKDYYSLYGIFSSTSYAFPGTEIYPHTKGFTALGSKEDAEKLKKYEDETAALDNEIEDTMAGKGPKLTPEEKKQKMDAARARVRYLNNHYPAISKAYGVTEGTPADAPVLRKGDPKSLGDIVPRGFLQILGGQRVPPEETGSGRRELAEWITDPNNPLTARVMVNRIWQHHFGKGIVATPNDFGVRGERPTHPELLDWLTARFLENGWSVKKMHRLMMLTRAYQQGSGNDARNATADAKSQFLWKFDRRRLDAEEIRDAILAVSSDLDPTMGGPHPFPPEPQWHFTQHTPFVASYDNNRRSVYLMQQRIRKQPFLESFDGADTNATTGARPITTTSLQALYFMNAPFTHDEADKLAVRVAMAFPTEPAHISYAYRLLLGRPATESETTQAITYLRTCRKALQEIHIPEDRLRRAALASYLRVLFSGDEFLYVD